MIKLQTRGKPHSSTCLLVLALAVIVIGCASTQEMTSITFTSNFDESQYINPQDFGYALSIREIEQRPAADSSFVPVFIKGGMRQAFGKVTYPREAQEQGLKGRVILQLYVNEKGSLAKAEIVESPDELLSKAALEAAQKWEYNPATLNDTPVNSFIQVPLNFRMQTQKIDINN